MILGQLTIGARQAKNAPLGGKGLFLAPLRQISLAFAVFRDVFNVYLLCQLAHLLSISGANLGLLLKRREIDE